MEWANKFVKGQSLKRLPLMERAVSEKLKNNNLAPITLLALLMLTASGKIGLSGADVHVIATEANVPVIAKF